MKNIRLNLYALSILAAFAAQAVTNAATHTNPPAPPLVGAKYQLNAQFTNNPPLLVNVNALPMDTANSNRLVAGGSGVIATDGSGKITGVQDITANLGGGTNAYLIANVTGSITGTGKSNGAALVSMSLKGTGFAWNSNGVQTAAAISLSFKGTTGITPNSQVVNTNLPGFDFVLNSDGTTNYVDRYDPYINTYGTNQTVWTLSTLINDWNATSVETTNGTTVLVTNNVDSEIYSVDVQGYNTCDRRSETILFGTPIGTNPVCQYQVQLGGPSFALVNRTTNVPVFLIAQSIYTVDRVPDSNNNVVVYTTNSSYEGSGLLTNVLLTNYTTYVDFWLASSNLFVTANYSFQNFGNGANYYYFVDPANVARGVIFDNVELDTNSNPVTDIYTINREYYEIAQGPTNAQGQFTYTNVQLVYTNTLRTNGSFPALAAFTEQIGNYTVYSNYVNFPATNFGLATNNIYGVALSNLPTVLAAWTSAHSFTNGYAYSGVTDYYEDNNLYPDMFLTNAEVRLVAQVTTNMFPANVTNVPVADRTATNKWYSISGLLNGSITAGKLTKSFKNEPGLFQGRHMFWTPIVATNGEADYYVSQISGNLDILTKSNFAAQVNMWNNKFTTASPLSEVRGLSYMPSAPPGLPHPPSPISESRSVAYGGYGSYGCEDDYSGTGSVLLKRGIGSYTARLTGLAWDAGSSLTLGGNTRTLITGYDVISNAPPVFWSITNFAAVPPTPAPPFVLTFSNTTSGYLYLSGDYTFTNVNGNMTTVYDFSYPSFRLTNVVYQTNYATNAISSVTLNGRIMGQILPKNTQGTNLDAVNYIGEVPMPASPTIDTNYYGWPLSLSHPYNY